MSNGSISVIVVDDDPSVYSSLVAFLDDEGFNVCAAHTGEEGLRLIDEKRPDVGIIDMRLPGIDGNILIERASASHPMMKFIILTGSSDYILNDAMRACGVVEENVFLKPLFDMMVLTEALHRIVGAEHAD